MKIFGKAQLIGAALFNPEATEMRFARMFSEGDMVVLHWHNEDNECQEVSFGTVGYALAHAKRIGVSHIIVGMDGSMNDAVPLVEAMLLAQLDGVQAFSNPLTGQTPNYIH